MLANRGSANTVALGHLLIADIAKDRRAAAVHITVRIGEFPIPSVRPVSEEANPSASIRSICNKF
jgi:hypothetical protein